MNILLTGATGFLGKQLVNDLLSDGHHIFILARNEKKAESLMSDVRNQDRVTAVYGDITMPLLGVKKDKLKALKNKIDAVYHMAALLSFDPADKEKTDFINIDGTKNVLEFCEKLIVSKLLYVSTAYTIGMETQGKEELYDVNRQFVNNYEESKCHAEHIVYSYKDRMQVCILRPAIIIGDSKTGEAKTNFGLYGLLRGIHILKRRMEKRETPNTFHILIEKDASSNLVPVDYVSSILKAALTYGENGKVYNIANPNPSTQEKVINIIKDVLNIPYLEGMSYKNEKDLTEEEKNFNQPLSVFKNYLSRTIHFPCENTKELIEQSNIELLDMDDVMLKVIVKGFLKRD